MKSLDKYVKECIIELETINIIPPRIEFTINTRAATRWGQCRKSGGKYYINIAAVLLREDAPVHALKSTLVHEILHTMPNCMNHGAQWQAYAEKVNKAYGYGVKRTDNYQDKGFTSNPLAEEHPYKYEVFCNECGRNWGYRRTCWTIECCRKNEAKCPCGASNFRVIAR